MQKYLESLSVFMIFYITFDIKKIRSKHDFSSWYNSFVMYAFKDTNNLHKLGKLQKDNVSLLMN